MKHESAHPSFLQLDNWALDPRSPAHVEIGQHIEQCPRCRGHIQKLQNPSPVPPWLPGMETPAPSRNRFWLFTPPWAGAFAAGMAAILVLVVWKPAFFGETVSPDVRTKGTPAVGVYVKRGERVWLWDGRSSIRPEDQLRLKVVPEGFSFVTVLTHNSEQVGAISLYEGGLDPKQEVLLPASWWVDADPDPENLFIVLSFAPLPEAEKLAVARNRAPSMERVWWTTFELPKELPRQEVAP